MAKILAFDVESAPNISYTWGKYDQTVPAFQQETYMLCYSWRWLGSKRTYVQALPDFKNYKPNSPDDRMLILSLWELFDEADIIIAHNGDAFDIKYANSRFVFHGMNPPSVYKTVDTLKIARRKFKFNSNKLDDLGDKLGVGRKIDTGGIQLWLDCMDGKRPAWRKMKKYNKQDVDLLIDVYEKIKNWAPNHPNLNVIDDTFDACSVCGSHDIIKNGYGFTNGSKYQRYQCRGCGANLKQTLAAKSPIKAE